MTELKNDPPYDPKLQYSQFCLRFALMGAVTEWVLQSLRDHQSLNLAWDVASHFTDAQSVRKAIDAFPTHANE